MILAQLRLGAACLRARRGAVLDGVGRGLPSERCGRARAWTPASPSEGRPLPYALASSSRRTANTSGIAVTAGSRSLILKISRGTSEGSAVLNPPCATDRYLSAGSQTTAAIRQTRAVSVDVDSSRDSAATDPETIRPFASTHGLQSSRPAVRSALRALVGRPSIVESWIQKTDREGRMISRRRFLSFATTVPAALSVADLSAGARERASVRLSQAATTAGSILGSRSCAELPPQRNGSLPPGRRAPYSCGREEQRLRPWRRCHRSAPVDLP